MEDVNTPRVPSLVLLRTIRGFLFVSDDSNFHIGTPRTRPQVLVTVDVQGARDKFRFRHALHGELTLHKLKAKSHVPSVLPTNIEQGICDLTKACHLYGLHQFFKHVSTKPCNFLQLLERSIGGISL
jgi:hypothetical protein